MRHNYAGDEGDYAKLALLRALTRGRRLGVNWYLTVHSEGEGQVGAGDGNLRKHLREDGWDHLDPELLDRMRSVFGRIEPADRSIDHLEDATMLPGATFFGNPLPTGATPHAERVAARLSWHEMALHRLEDTDVVFVDPDNGFQVKSQGPRSERFCKYATYAEVAGYLARGKAVVAYQHRPRHTWERVVEMVRGELARRDVPTAPPSFIAFGSRGFFLMHPDPAVVRSMTQAAEAMRARAQRDSWTKLAITVTRRTSRRTVFRTSSLSRIAASRNRFVAS